MKPRQHHSYTPSRLDAPLVIAAQRGGPDEREALIEASMPLIGSLARRYERTAAVERSELLQEGVVGLLRALERYDAERGVPFWSYATWWVRQAMQHLVSHSRPIVMSDRALRQLATVRRAQRSLEQQHRRPPSPLALADETGLPRGQVEVLLRANRRARSLDEPVGDEGGSTVISEQLADPRAQDSFDGVGDRALASELPSLLERLSDRERTVIGFRFGLAGREHTLHEVAARLAVSAERVRQIERASLEKLHTAAVCR
jgi:RNA polymerase sigma factor (sigma-70 family)